MRYYEYEAEVIDHECGVIKAKNKKEALEKVKYQIMGEVIGDIEINLTKKPDWRDEFGE